MLGMAIEYIQPSSLSTPTLDRLCCTAGEYSPAGRTIRAGTICCTAGEYSPAGRTIRAGRMASSASRPQLAVDEDELLACLRTWHLLSIGLPFSDGVATSVESPITPPVSAHATHGNSYGSSCSSAMDVGSNTSVVAGAVKRVMPPIVMPMVSVHRGKLRHPQYKVPVDRLRLASMSVRHLGH